MGPSDRQSCIQGCRDAARRFIDWFDEQMRLGKPNYGNAPDCPCSISCKKDVCTSVGPTGPNIQTIDTVCAPNGWYIAPPVGYPFYLERLHPGAVWDLRSNQVPRTQCTYDNDGKLITTGPGIGTVDETDIRHGHLPIDVTPVDWIITLEGGKLTEGCWFNMYKSHASSQEWKQMSTEPVKQGLNREFHSWIRLVGTVAVALQLPIVFVLVYDTLVTGSSWENILDTDQYWIWILNQVDTAIVFSIVAAILFRCIENRWLALIAIAVLLVVYGLVGGLVLYIRAVGGLGGL